MLARLRWPPLSDPTGTAPRPERSSSLQDLTGRPRRPRRRPPASRRPAAWRNVPLQAAGRGAGCRPAGRVRRFRTASRSTPPSALTSSTEPVGDLGHAGQGGQQGALPAPLPPITATSSPGARRQAERRPCQASSASHDDDAPGVGAPGGRHRERGRGRAVGSRRGEVSGGGGCRGCLVGSMAPPWCVGRLPGAFPVLPGPEPGQPAEGGGQAPRRPPARPTPAYASAASLLSRRWAIRRALREGDSPARASTTAACHELSAQCDYRAGGPRPGSGGRPRCLPRGRRRSRQGPRASRCRTSTGRARPGCSRPGRPWSAPTPGRAPRRSGSRRCGAAGACRWWTTAPAAAPPRGALGPRLVRPWASRTSASRCMLCASPGRVDSACSAMASRSSAPPRSRPHHQRRLPDQGGGEGDPPKGAGRGWRAAGSCSASAMISGYRLATVEQVLRHAQVGVEDGAGHPFVALGTAQLGAEAREPLPRWWASSPCSPTRSTSCQGSSTPRSRSRASAATVRAVSMSPVK